MEVKIEKLNPVHARLKIQVPPATVNAKLDAYFANLAKRVRVPGFRPGKAPKQVVQKMYQSETAADVSERLIAESVLTAVRDHKLSLVMPPTLVATDLPEADKAFQFEVEVDLKPEVPAIDLKGITIESDSDSTQVTDEEINQRIANLQEKEATFSDLSTPRPVKDKDYVIISFNGSVDGVEHPGMKAENQTLILGQNQFLPDFEAAVIGMNPGDEKTAKVGFPEGYHAKDLAGKTADFQIKLVSIKEKNLPALDEAFVKNQNPEWTSVDQLKAELRKEIQEQKDRSTKEKLREKVGDALAAKYPLALSPRHLQSAAQRIAEQTHHMMHQMGVQHEETEEHAKSLLDASVRKAERDLRLSYLLERIAEEQKFEVNDDDLKTRYEAMAKRTGLSVSQIRRYYAEKDEGAEEPRVERLKLEVLDEKSLDYALSKATIKSKGSTS